MPTKNRRMFISQSIKYFQNQDYPNKELIIYDTGTDKVKDLIPNSTEIHYFSDDPGLKLGDARNAVINKSKGDIIVTWDDDDWSADNRISKQIKPIIKNEADLTSYAQSFRYDMNSDQCWLRYSTTGPDWGANNTLSFRKQTWEKLAKYPSQSLHSDEKFIHDCLKKELKLMILPNNGEFVAISHLTNTDVQLEGHNTAEISWKKINPPDFFCKDILFYKNLRNQQQTVKELKSFINEMKEKQVKFNLFTQERLDEFIARNKILLENKRELLLKIKFLREKNEELRQRLKSKNLK